MKVINIALRRSDGKVETDTIYRDTLFTYEEVEEMGIKFDCDVIISHIGQISFFSEDGKDDENYTMSYTRPKKEEATNGESQICDNVQLAQNPTE